MLHTLTSSKQKIGGMLAPNINVEEHPLSIFLRRIKQDVNFYFSLIGFKPTWQQKQYVDAVVAGESNIAVRSGKGPGKTTVTAVMTPWWSLTSPMSRAVITAPTMRQCKDVWLAEAAKWIGAGNRQLKSCFSFTNTGYGVVS